MFRLVTVAAAFAELVCCCPLVGCCAADLQRGSPPQPGAVTRHPADDGGRGGGATASSPTAGGVMMWLGLARSSFIIGEPIPLEVRIGPQGRNMCVPTDMGMGLSERTSAALRSATGKGRGPGRPEAFGGPLRVTVTRDGEAVPYRGWVGHKDELGPSDYACLSDGQSIRTEVDIGAGSRTGFELGTPAEYIVEVQYLSRGVDDLRELVRNGSATVACLGGELEGRFWEGSLSSSLRFHLTQPNSR
jgi:hypothetical protein